MQTSSRNFVHIFLEIAYDDAQYVFLSLVQSNKLTAVCELLYQT